MKRFSIISVLSLLAGLLAIVAGAAPAYAHESPDTAITSDSPQPYGHTVTLQGYVGTNTLGLNEAPHGTVDFYDVITEANQVLLGKLELHAQEAEYTAQTDPFPYCCLSVGTHKIRGYYVSSNGQNPSSGETTVEITQAVTFTTLSQASTDTVYGQPVDFKATVTRNTVLGSAPTGTVDFAEDTPSGTTIYRTVTLGADGTATATLNLPAGTRNLKAVYSGDTNYKSSVSGCCVHFVARGATTDSMVATASNTTFGQPVTLTSTVAPVSPSAGTPTGTVSFIDCTTCDPDPAIVLGTGALNEGSPDTATLTISSLTPGAHNLASTYPGDSNFFGSSSGSVWVTVTKAHTTTTVTTSVSPSTLGQSVLFTASVLGDYNTVPTGTVQFKDGSTNIGSPRPMVNGVSTLQLSTLAGGTHTITAVYSGDNNHNGSSGTVSQTVTCDRVVSGSVSSVDASGTTCLTNATVGGSVKVPAGAKLSLVNSTVGGVLSAASGAGPITICGTTVGGGVKITGAGGFVLIGDPVEDACAANTLNSGVTLSGNTGGVELGFNRIGGSVSVTNNVGPGPGAAHASPEVQANNIGGTLGCSGNSPVVSNDGRPNSVGGGRSGECGAAGF